MPFHFLPSYLFQYLFRKRVNQFFLSIALRSLAVGMVFIFEPIYIFRFFDNSVYLTLLFFGTIHLVYALLAVQGGKIMARLGFARCIFISHFFLAGYYLSLRFLNLSFWIIPLALLLNILAKMFFWPSFHTEFVRFSSREHRGEEVGKMNASLVFPTIFAPLLGGFILANFGYPGLFASVFSVLLASTIPLFFTKASREVYNDSFKNALQRILKKENLPVCVGLFFAGIEASVNYYFWPLFMFLIAVGYFSMGVISSFSILVATLFMLYIGKLSDSVPQRAKLLEIGGVLSAISWVLKFFVSNAFNAFLAENFYKVCRASLSVPFQTVFYERAAVKKTQADEFIIAVEMLVNFAKAIFFAFFGFLFLIFAKVNIAFLIASACVLGMRILLYPPERLVNFFDRVLPEKSDFHL